MTSSIIIANKKLPLKNGKTEILCEIISGNRKVGFKWKRKSLEITGREQRLKFKREEISKFALRAVQQNTDFWNSVY